MIFALAGKVGQQRIEMSSVTGGPGQDFCRDKHIKYFMYMLQMCPNDYEGFDSKRMMILYLALSGLDLLGALRLLDAKTRQRTIDWIYAMQKVPPRGSDPDPRVHYGFRGGPSYGGKFDPACGGEDAKIALDEPHIAMTYSALCALMILGDDMKRVNKRAIVQSLSLLQKDNGSFRCATTEEDDMRFVYCACAISDILGDWSGVDKDLTVKFITDCQAFDGAIGIRRGAEGHGGTTYCAVSSLTLMGRLGDLRNRAALVRWCVQAQGSGFVGRPNKPADSCYSWWIGSTMKSLGIDGMSTRQTNRAFNLKCQTEYGGFGKHPGLLPDILHSYFGVCGMSLMGLDGVAPVNHVWGVSQRAAKRPAGRAGPGAGAGVKTGEAKVSQAKVSQAHPAADAKAGRN